MKGKKEIKSRSAGPLVKGKRTVASRLGHKSLGMECVTRELATVVGTPNEGGDVHVVCFVRDVSICVKISNLIHIFT